MNIAVASDFPTVSSNVSPHREAVADPRSPSRLHPGVIRFTAAAYIAMTSALLIGFAGPADLHVPFYIIALCLVVFIALALVDGPQCYQVLAPERVGGAPDG